MKYVLSFPVEHSCGIFPPIDKCLASYTLKMHAGTRKYSPQDIHVSYEQGFHLIVRTTFCMYLRPEKKTSVKNLKLSVQ